MHMSSVDVLSVCMGMERCCTWAPADDRASAARRVACSTPHTSGSETLYSSEGGLRVGGSPHHVRLGQTGAFQIVGQQRRR
jgi:hypothetical protein